MLITRGCGCDLGMVTLSGRMHLPLAVSYKSIAKVFFFMQRTCIIDVICTDLQYVFSLHMFVTVA